MKYSIAEAKKYQYSIAAAKRYLADWPEGGTPYNYRLLQWLVNELVRTRRKLTRTRRKGLR